MKKVSILMVVTLSLMLGAGISFSPVAFAAEPVKIGAIFSLTGPIGPHGQESLHAVELAVEEINKSGGVLGGRPLELIVEDSESRPKAAVEAAHKLADVNKVPIAIGGYSSGLALPIGEYLNSVKVVWITDATTNKLKTVGPYLFDTADLADQAVALVDFAWADINARKFATLSENNPIGQD